MYDNKKNQIKLVNIWLPPFSGILAFAFIFYKSIYQSPQHLNNLVGMIILIVLLGLFFNSDSHWVGYATPLLVSLLFFPPLYWLWRTGQYDTTVIGGIIPIQDMLQYYSDALRLQYGYRLSIFSSNRPLFPGFLSAILKLTDNNLQLSLIILTLLVVLSVVLLAFEIKKTFGGFTAMAVVVMIYFCYKGYGFIGKTMTEQIGLPLGALALSLFLHGMRNDKLFSILFGLATLTFALNARAGAFFVIPALVVWGVFEHNGKKFYPSRFIGFIVAVIIGFLLNYLIVKGIGNLQGVPFENFGHTFYGLVNGYRGWPALLIDHPGSRGKDAWPYVFEILKAHPENLPLGILKAYIDYFRPETMFRFLYFSPESRMEVSYLLWGLMIWGVGRLFRLSSASKFFLWVLVGIFVSIPFVPPIDDGIRALTVTIPFQMLILALPFSIPKSAEFVKDTDENMWLYGYTLFFITSIVAGSLLIRFIPDPTPILAPLDCPIGATPMAVWAKSGSFLRLVENDSRSYSLVPDLRVRDFRESTAKNPFDFLNEISPIFRRMGPNQTILASLNLYNLSENSKAIIIIVPTNHVQVGQINRYCSYYLITDTYGVIDLFLEDSLYPADFLND